MTLALDLSAETEKKLRERAAARGMEPSDYVLELLRHELEGGGASVFSATEPFARAVEASGMTEQEMADVVEEVREGIWRERQTARVSEPSPKKAI